MAPLAANIPSRCKSFSILLTRAFFQNSYPIDDDEARKFENGQEESAGKNGIEAFVRLRITIYSKNK